jgi:hypothetical protein
MLEDENHDHLWLRTENHSISYVFCQDKCLVPFKLENDTQDGILILYKIKYIKLFINQFVVENCVLH